LVTTLPVSVAGPILRLSSDVGRICPTVQCRLPLSPVPGGDVSDNRELWRPPPAPAGKIRCARRSRTNAEHVQPFANRDPSTTVRTPIAGISIPPSPVTKMRDEAQMQPRTSLAARTGTIETDRIRQLLPIDRVEPAILGADRHRDYMS